MTVMAEPLSVRLSSDRIRAGFDLARRLMRAAGDAVVRMSRIGHGVSKDVAVSGKRRAPGRVVLVGAVRRFALLGSMKIVRDPPDFAALVDSAQSCHYFCSFLFFRVSRRYFVANSVVLGTGISFLS